MAAECEIGANEKGGSSRFAAWGRAMAPLASVISRSLHVCVCAWYVNMYVYMYVCVCVYVHRQRHGYRSECWRHAMFTEMFK
jgi:hypothetical protein